MNIHFKALLCLLFVNVVYVDQQIWAACTGRQVLSTQTQANYDEILGEIAEPTRVLPAAKRVVAKYLSAGRTRELQNIIINYGTSVSSHTFDDPDFTDQLNDSRWPDLEKMVQHELSLVDTLNTFETETGISILEIVVQINGKYVDKFFRPLQNENGEYLNSRKVRKTIAAAVFNRALGLDTVASAEIVRVDGRIGALSDKVDGVETTIRGVDVKNGEFIMNEDIDQENWSDVLAFEFLYGNQDLFSSTKFQLKNMKIGNDNKSKVYDHDTALITYLQNYHYRRKDQSRTPGFIFPDRYSDKFINGIFYYTNERIRKLLGPFASQAELEAMYFRREVILEDLAIRLNIRP